MEKVKQSLLKEITTENVEEKYILRLDQSGLTKVWQFI